MTGRAAATDYTEIMQTHRPLATKSVAKLVRAIAWLPDKQTVSLNMYLSYKFTTQIEFTSTRLVISYI